MKTLLHNPLAILACSACWVLPLPLTAQAPVSNLISHQGRVAVRENPGDPPVNFSGNGLFKFALVNGDGTTLWSNDNTSSAGSEPVGAVPLTVNKGLYSVMLGEGMWNIPATVFQNQLLFLRVWFSDGTAKGFQQLLPDQRLAPNGYLPSGAISAGNLADGSITTAKIAAGSVTASKMAAGTVIPSQGVAGASHAMVANTSYNVFTATPMTLTLPTTASVGDTVKVSGVGSGGWSVIPPSGQVLVPRWIPRETSRQWQSVASSADGSKLVAVVGNGQIHTSADSGLTWTPRESNRNWRGVASSADGSKLVAVAALGHIYTSTDFGVSWTARATDENRSWRSVASSSDGTKLVAVVAGGQIYTSSDSGVTWSAHETNRDWRSVASSADGAKLVAVAYEGLIYTSSDSGMNWTSHGSNKRWVSVASSADGEKLCAVGFYEFIHTSTDAGLNWNENQGSFIRAWQSVASSADGNYLVAVHGASDGQIQTSSDGGVTWAPSESARDWYSVASSSDGRKLVAVAYGDQIYTSDTTVSGSQGQSAVLQYLGSGQWTSIGQTGSGAGLTELNAGNLVGSVPSAALTSVPAASLTGAVPSASLTSVPAANLTGSVPSATLTSVPAASLTGSVPSAALTSVPAASLTGSVPSAALTSVPASSLTGSVPTAALTSVPAASLTGFVPSAALTSVPASSLTGVVPPAALTSVPAASLTGTIFDLRLSSNVALRAGGNSFSGNQSIAGNVGIGTTSPGKPLQIGDAGISNSEGMMRFASRSGTGPSSRYWDIGVPEGDQDTSGKFYSFVIDDPTSGGDPEMTIRWDSGNVGLGTANPQGRLHLYSAANPTVMRVQSSGTPGFGRLEFVSNPQGDANEWRPAYIQSTDSGSFTGGLSFVVNGTGAANKFTEVETMRIQNGRVGIGTSAPASALHVIGTVTATAFNPPSDRNLKENFEPVDAREVLEKVAAMPISRWNFIGDSETPHIGPMAQDFHAAFGTGTDDRHIATVDADGVALAAIQGLNEKLEEKDAQIKELTERLEALEELLSRQQSARTQSNPNPTAR